MSNKLALSSNPKLAVDVALRKPVTLLNMASYRMTDGRGDALSPLLAEPSHHHHLMDHRKLVRVEVWCGFNNPFKQIFQRNRLYLNDGSFQDIIEEEHTPRIVTVVSYHGVVASCAMLVNASEVMGVSQVAGYHSLGFLGLFTRPEFRGNGLSSWALQCLNSHLMLRLKRAPLEVQQRACVQAMDHVIDWCDSHMALPVFNI